MPFANLTLLVLVQSNHCYCRNVSGLHEYCQRVIRNGWFCWSVLPSHWADSLPLPMAVQPKLHDPPYCMGFRTVNHVWSQVSPNSHLSNRSISVVPQNKAICSQLFCTCSGVLVHWPRWFRGKFPSLPSTKESVATISPQLTLIPPLTCEVVNRTNHAVPVCGCILDW